MELPLGQGTGEVDMFRGNVSFQLGPVSVGH